MFIYQATIILSPENTIGHVFSAPNQTIRLCILYNSVTFLLHDLLYVNLFFSLSKLPRHRRKYYIVRSVGKYCLATGHQRPALIEDATCLFTRNVSSIFLTLGTVVLFVLRGVPGSRTIFRSFDLSSKKLCLIYVHKCAFLAKLFQNIPLHQHYCSKQKGWFLISVSIECFCFFFLLNANSC